MKKPVTILIISLLLVFSACKKAADLAKYKDQAIALAGTYGPQLGDLAKKLPDLLGRAKSLPVNLPGLDKVTKLIQDNKGHLDQLQGLLANLPQQVATGKPEEAAKVIAGAEKQLAEGVSAVSSNVATVETEVGALEQAAKIAPPAPTGEFAPKLSSGFEIKASRGGVEEQLIAFLQAADKAVDTTTWFDFDRVVFQQGKAEIDAAKSNVQLANVVEILKAFPNAKLKVGGYTDNTGSADANKRISMERAEAVVASIVSGGIAKGRLEAEGYGPEHPVCPANDTDECKAKNRRISIRVTAK